jgi:hypothetical protein
MDHLLRRRIGHAMTVTLWFFTGSFLVVIGLLFALQGIPNSGLTALATGILLFAVGVSMVCVIPWLLKGFHENEQAVRNGMNATVIPLGKDEKPLLPIK